MTPSGIDTARLFDHTPFVEQHAAVLELFDTLAPDTQIDGELARLLQLVQQQFAAEEDGMRAAHFPPHLAHKKDHDGALASLSGHIADWHQGRDRSKLLGYLETELADWFVSHVNRRDYITARHIAMAQQYE